MPYWHLAAYSETAALNDTNVDTDAAEDGVLQRRNSHLIVSEPYNLIGACAIGSSLTRMRFNNASLTPDGIPHVWPLNVSATIPDRPWISDFRGAPWKLPMDEEILVEHSNGAAAQTALLLWLATPQWRVTMPPYERALTVRATVVIAAGSENTWGLPVTIVMERDLRQGAYSVVGCHVVAADALAFRMVFPTQKVVYGRQHRPGGLVQNTATTLPSEWNKDALGEWGRFHTFELPQIQVFSDAAGGTYEVRLHLLKLGSDRNLVYYN